MSAPTLTAEWLQGLFAPLSSASAVLAAVSGGPDSMALMHLLSRWTALGYPPVLVATVDHGLRPEAAEEAAWVGREAARLGLPHRVLAWEGDKPGTGLQAAAREARYALLTRHARACGASHLVTAHTLDDQAETVLMRLAHGSGLAGLSGMHAERRVDGIRHARPLLGLRKSALLALCADHGWASVADPSNANPRFERVRWRALMPALAREGLTAERLAGFATRAARADAALRAKAKQALEQGFQDALARSQDPAPPNRMADVGAPGALVFEAACLIREPYDIALRVLDLALARALPSPDHRRLGRLETCLERLRGALERGEALRLTVAGAILSLNAAGRLAITAEPPRRRGR
ncbi:tRNA lysidine(34) synthetase TilS [Microvirga pudoricolor]|uniref:tRNA lysidine(34) synthetase TilS n=1 Tax=Microvirga pudoricolor TaxID=2778729 RepID=UPI00194E41C9|nr:tRNA lysidine(34) synthetase TilS [Microvirga pudoricolor]MBM6593050.1 tRNA lysidine(34) synthetase TilS [Microvirga pudoricolor]